MSRIRFHLYTFHLKNRFLRVSASLQNFFKIPDSSGCFGINFFFLLSLSIVALGQPARVGFLGALASAFGFTLFFCAIPARFSKRQRFLCGSLWFTLVQLVQLSWMTAIEFQGYYILLIYFLLSVGIGLQFGLLTLFIPRVGKLSILKVLSGAALWMLMEYARLYFICGFSWNPIGLALTQFLFSLQFVSVFGVFGLSFWVMLTNLYALNAWREKFTKKSVALWSVVAAVPYLFGVFFLMIHLPKSEGEGGAIRAALIQTELLPSQKIPYPGRMNEYVSPFVQWNLIVAGLKEKFVQKWDMIVLPEAALPLQSDMALYSFSAVREILVKELGREVEKEFPLFSYPYAQEREINGIGVMFVSNLFWCQTLSNYFKAELIAGLDHTDKDKRKNFNSAFYLKPQSGVIQRYDKQVLLPLAEYLPFNFLRSLGKRYGIYDFFSRGKESKVFGEKIIFSPSICYEETFPAVMREGRLKGAQLFVNVTNDNYFPRSNLHYQHLYHARLRAVENGVPLLRACNSGVSAAIDCFGRIVSKMDAGQNVQGCVLSCSLSSYVLPTLYSWCGDVLIVSCSLSFLLVFYISQIRKRNIY